jgi:hypothetical protein
MWEEIFDDTVAWPMTAGLKHGQAKRSAMTVAPF